MALRKVNLLGYSRCAFVWVTVPFLLAAATGCRQAPAQAPDSRRELSRDLKFAMESARAGLWNEALYRWERAIQDRPADARLHNNLAVALENEGRYEEARDMYDRAQQLDPDDDRILQNRNAFENFYRRHLAAGGGLDSEDPEEEAHDSTPVAQRADGS